MPKKLFLTVAVAFTCFIFLPGCAGPTAASVPGTKVESEKIAETIKTGDVEGQNASLVIREVVINGNTVTIAGALDDKVISLTGTLYESFREGKNGKILVGEVEDKQAGLRSVYLEINSCEYDSTDPQSRLVTNCWVFDDTLTFEKTFILYLIDENEDWYLFESKLSDVPIDVTKIDLNQLIIAERVLDTGWYMPYIEK